MTEIKKYNAAIIGGGLAGLALSIRLREFGHGVVLFEKEQYPFHKVCGEYISMESRGYLESLGLPLNDMDLPVITKLVVTAPSGNYLQQELGLGGFGISRYTLDNELKKIAVHKGVVIHDGCKVDDVSFDGKQFVLTTPLGTVESDVCCGSYGKKSNLDIKLRRGFVAQKKGKLNNYVGVKYHIRTVHPADTIALHNFENGYCGISKVEGDKYCLCYLTTAADLNKHNNSIAELERNVLYKNRHLQKIFTNSVVLYKQPVTISQVSFAKKSQVTNHMLMLGDAAGMITPLCGNGMSMALHSSKIVGQLVNEHLQKRITRAQLEDDYTKQWQHEFSTRLFTGRMIQQLFGKAAITNIFVGFMKRFPDLARMLVKNTHGEPF